MENAEESEAEFLRDHDLIDDMRLNTRRKSMCNDDEEVEVEGEEEGEAT